MSQLNAISRKKPRKEFRVPISFTLEQLDCMILYILTDSKLIKRKELNRLQTLFKILEPSIYEKEVVLDYRYQFIKCMLDARLKHNITEYSILMDLCLRNNSHKEELAAYINELEDLDDLNDAEINYVSTLVSEHLTYSYLFKYKDKIVDFFEEIELGTDDLYKLNAELKKVLVNLMKDMRKAKPDESEEQDFDLAEGMEDILLDTANELKQPSNYLQTGIQRLNQLLNGGFEQDRQYTFFGIAGVGKSVILLSIAYQLVKYNQHLEPSSPDKKLCVLYITQENSRKETIQRLWKIAVDDEDITCFNDEEIVQKFKGVGLTMESSKINLKIMYRPNKSISTDDLYDIIDSIQDEGYEVIAVLHDYTKRILPSNPTNDLRIDLGAVIDEECTIAKTYHIPFITAGQINRAGAQTIEDALQRGKEDVGRLLSSSNVGESFLMIENTDFACIINREYKASSNTAYYTFKEIKARSKSNSGDEIITYFAHPVSSNGIRLVEDLNFKKPASLLSLAQDQNLDTENVMRSRRSSTSGRRSKQSVDKVSDETKDVMDDFDIIE